MTSNISAATVETSSPYNNCPRRKCKLRLVNIEGIEECLMETTREQWSAPSLTRYCEDPLAKRFVDYIHSK
jgi:hypothetical protein